MRRGRITVQCRRVGERVEILIQDDGPGMSDSDLQQVFEPLFSTKGFGLGLGLSIVRRIMQQHGGDVSLESTDACGIIARLWLPAVMPP